MTDFPHTSDTWNDSLIVHNQLQRAAQIRKKLIAFLKQHNAWQQKYWLAVDYTRRDTFEFCLRVQTHTHPIKTVLELWAPTPAELMSDRNLALLLILYNS